MRPPVLATWVLQLAPGCGRNEALQGDLFEEYQRRGSALWYWGQVITAVLALGLNHLQESWEAPRRAMLSALFVALIWTYCFSFCWETIVLGPSHLFLNAWLARRASVMGFVYAPAAGILLYGMTVTVGLVLYLVITRRFSARTVTRGFLVALSAAAGEFVVWVLLTRTLYSPFAIKLVQSLWTWFSWQPLFFVLLLSMWAAGRKEESPEDVLRNLRLE